MRRVGVGLLLTGLLSMFPAVPARPATVIYYASIKDFTFGAPIRVRPGWEVRWTNSGPSAHTVATDAGDPEEFASPTLQKGDAYQHPFSVVGKYTYHCAIHSNMKATLYVQTNAPVPASPTPSAAPKPSKSPSPSPTPRRSSSPSPSVSPKASPKPRATATVAAVHTLKPSPSPSPTLKAAGVRDSGGTSGWVALIIVAMLGGVAVLVYQRFVHGT